MARVSKTAIRTTHVATDYVAGSSLIVRDVRDFVRALDELGVPDTVGVTTERDGLSVRFSEDIEGWPNERDVAPPTCGAIWKTQEWGQVVCERLTGHEGEHRVSTGTSGDVSWYGRAS